MGKATLIATIVCLGTLAAFVWFSEPTMSSLEVKHAQQGANLANSQQIHAQGSVGSNCCPQFLPVGYNSNNLLAQNAYYGFPYGIHSLDGRYGDYSSYLSGSNIVGAPGYSIQGLSGNQVIDLSNAQLSGTHLSGAHLSGAHLSGAHLSGAHFAGSPVGLSSQTISSSGISGLNQGVTVTGPAGASQSGGVTVITTRPVTSSSASGTQVIEGGQGHGLNVHTISGGISSSGSASIQGGSGRSFSEGGSGIYTGRAGVNVHQGYNVYGLHGLHGVRTNVVNVPVHVPVRAGTISTGAVAGAASSVGGIAGYTHGVRTNVVNVPVPVPVRVGSVAASAGAAARGGSVSGGSSSSGSSSSGSVSGGSSSSSSSSSSEGSSFEGGSGSSQSGSFSYNLGGYSGESSSSSGGSDSRSIENVWSNSTVYQNHILNPYSSNGGSSGGSSSSSSSSSDKDKDKDD